MCAFPSYFPTFDFVQDRVDAMNRTSYCRTLLLVVLSGWSVFSAQAWYIGKEEFSAATFHNGELSHYNYVAGNNDINLITTEIEPNSGLRPLISLEITNRNCREGKSYPAYYRTTSGEKKFHKINRPEWGLLWGYRNAENYHALLFRTGESDPQGFDPPTLQYCILTVANGDTLLHQPWNNTPNSYLNPEAGYNHLLIRPVDGGFEIFIGEEREYRLGLCADDRLFGNEAGIYIGSGANVVMRNWKITPQKYVERTPYLTEEEIFARLNESTNPYEGIYELIGSGSYSSNLRLGGKYRVALIYDNDEFKMLYLDGAQRAADLWKPGMIKAIFRHISEGEIFHAIWFDANHTPISDETKAFFQDQLFRVIFSWNNAYLNFMKISPDSTSPQKKSDGNIHLI